MRPLLIEIECEIDTGAARRAFNETFSHGLGHLQPVATDSYEVGYPA